MCDPLTAVAVASAGLQYQTAKQQLDLYDP